MDQTFLMLFEVLLGFLVTVILLTALRSLMSKLLGGDGGHE